MAAPHLLFERVRDDFGVELRPLFADHDLKREVEQHVAQLVAHRIRVVGPDRVIELQDLLDEIGAKSLGGLRAIPRATLP
ncbi:MAG TPA: hypothetical protein VL549_04590 [Gemmatimonadales bacterium]|nr:hypothetical protein [Gemmatimonadales bacterium]